MPPTKKSNPESKSRIGVQIYLTPGERELLTSDLNRANSHRTKKLSMNEFLRSRVFAKNIRTQDQVPPLQTQNPILTSNVEAAIRNVLEEHLNNQSLIRDSDAQLLKAIEQIVEQKTRLVREDLLDVKGEIKQLSKKPWEL